MLDSRALSASADSPSISGTRRLFDARSLQHLLPLHDAFSETQQEDRSTWPHLRWLIVRGHLGLEPTAVTDAFNNTRHKCRAIELIHFPRHTNVGIDERIVVRNHVFIRGVWGDRMLEGVG